MTRAHAPEQMDAVILRALWGSRPAQWPDAWASAALVARGMQSWHGVEMSPGAVGRALTRLAREGRCERQYRAGFEYRLMVEPENPDAI